MRAHDSVFTGKTEKKAKFLEKRDKKQDKIDLTGTQLNKLVVNISRRQLSGVETSVLVKGLNLAVDTSRSVHSGSREGVWNVRCK